MVLISVLLFAAIISVLAAGLMGESSSQMLLANRTVLNEQALYVAAALLAVCALVSFLMKRSATIS